VPPQPTGFAGYLHAVADALEGQGGAEVTLSDGRRSIELVTAVYASIRAGGQPVRLPLTPDAPLYTGWQPAAP
jgi:predicted dehydrogenase